MNNQLEHLQNSIETLVNRYQAAVREKQALSKKISEMDAAWQKQRHDHRATVDGLQLAYSERMSRMERELSGQIEALQQENAVYRKLLEQSAAKISEMDAAWQKQRHDHRATMDGLQLAYSERMSRMERELTSQIEALQQENAAYRKLLEQSAADIRALLQRLPVPAAKEQVV